MQIGTLATTAVLGVGAYNDLQAALQEQRHIDDRTGPARKAYYTTTVTNGEVVPRSSGFEALVQNLRLPLGMYRNVRTYKFRLHREPIFENLYNARAGVIIAKENARFRDENDPANQRLDWQEEAFLSYSEMAVDQHVRVTRSSVHPSIFHHAPSNHRCY